MSYEYQSWADAMRAKHGDVTQENMLEFLEPDPLAFIDHQKEQCKQAKAAGAYDDRWRALENASEHARAALQGENRAAEAMALVSLGEAIRTVSAPVSDLRAMRLEMAAMKRQLPTRERQAFIAAVGKYAANRWQSDHRKEIRLSDMCEVVWSELFEEFGDQLPDTAKGLRSWLKPVAPAYAQAPGRPKRRQ